MDKFSLDQLNIIPHKIRSSVSVRTKPLVAISLLAAVVVLLLVLVPTVRCNLLIVKGELEEGLGLEDEAIGDFQGAHKADPSSVAALTNLARLMEKRGDNEAAWDLFLQLYNSNDGHNMAIPHLATLSFSKKQYKET